MAYELNGVPIQALVYLGVIHNFLATRETWRLNLDLVKVANYIKMVNIGIATLVGLAKDVVTKVGRWHDKLDFLVL